jgi:endonuclease/exonuclease/phosphatase family metal-dependent hydrolase
MKKIFLLFLIAIWQLALTAQSVTPINVASFNLRLNTASDGENAWPHRSEFVMDLIRYHEFDIIGTQEAFHGQIKDLLNMEEFAYTGSGRDDGQQGGEHAAIFYNKERFELLQSGDFWLSETPDKPSLGWDATCCHRVCSWAQFWDKENDRSFFVFNAHFDHEGVIAREESGKLMMEKIREIAGNQPAIFCGDLNSTPDTQQVKHIAGHLQDAYNISETKPYGPVGTFSGFILNAPLKDRIDYVFVSEAFKVAKYGALTDMQDNRFPSDHLPVVAKLYFKNGD